MTQTNAKGKGRSRATVGIGFKAVFQYTNTPHIYDPHISFKIRDLIVPVLLEQEPHPLRKNDETLFYFPFDRLEKPAQDALDEIEDKLKNTNLISSVIIIIAIPQLLIILYILLNNKNIAIEIGQKIP